MSQFSRFMKENKTKKENEKYAPTASLTEEDGSPLLWEFRHLTSKEAENLRDECTIEIPVKGKPNQYRADLNVTKYVVKLIVAATVYPDLYDKELQDSYGVLNPEDLVFCLIDDPGEYNDFSLWMQKFQGFTKTLQEDIDEAKN